MTTDTRLRNVTPVATHFGTLSDRGIAGYCYVLEDRRRILERDGLLEALGFQGNQPTRALAKFSKWALELRPAPMHVTKVVGVLAAPIRFRDADGKLRLGYEADVLAQFAQAVLMLRRHGVIDKDHVFHAYADAAERLLEGLAVVGITALIDEATGFQRVREDDALAKILDRYLNPVASRWAKRFPDAFYKEIYRLRGWEWRGRGVNPPSVVGTYTNDLVYDRLAPGILERLQQINPVDESGRRSARHHQHLTIDVGVPELDRHLAGVIAILRTCQNWSQAKIRMDQAYPIIGDTMLLLGMEQEPEGEAPSPR